MSLTGAFLNSSLAMTTQAYAMGQISNNVTNINTTGYKGIDTTFQTLLAEQPVGSSPYGIKAVSSQRIDVQGVLMQTGDGLNLAINGQGFFMTNESFDMSGETFYTRDGNFWTQMVYDATGTTSPPTDGSPATGDTYLMTAGGQYVMGWAADMDAWQSGGEAFPLNTSDTGGVDGADPLVPILINSSEALAGTETTLVSVMGNIDQTADSQILSLPVWGPEVQTTGIDGTTSSTWPHYDVGLAFTSTSKSQNTWDIAIHDLNGEIGTIQPPTIAFAPTGAIAEPADGMFEVSMTYPDGNTHTFAVDLSDLTQFAGTTDEPLIRQIQVDGYPEGVLETAYLDNKGVLWGRYTNGTSQPMYKLAMADFPAPNSLSQQGNNLYGSTPEAGERVIYAPGSGVWTTASQLVPGALELSNVDLADEFTRMITTQTAYSTAATVFRTTDEMTQTASTLKS